MQYLGGKSKLAAKFAPEILRFLEHQGTDVLIEPFVGGFNILPRLPGVYGVCSDVHPGLAVLYRAVADGWDPPDDLSREEYAALRVLQDWENPLTTFACFGCSFGGKAWGGYASNNEGRNYAGFAARSLRRKRAALQRCSFSICPYNEIDVPDGAVVYCDPPYSGTTEYSTKAFAHSAFFKWADELRKRGCLVLVSEFEGSLPESWGTAWSFERRLDMGDRSYRTEIIGLCI